MAVKGDEDPYSENFIRLMKVYKGVGIFENQKSIENLKVSQNFPNPFSKITKVQVELFKTSNVAFEITNLTGQKVLKIDKGYLQKGLHIINIEAINLNPGLYFYTVKAGEAAITRKMVVE